MVIIQKRSKRKPSGGRYKKLKTKKLSQRGSSPVLTRLDERKVKKVRTKGGNIKLKLLRTNKINVIDQKTKKAKKAEIKNVLDNPANRNYTRQNIITKGSILDTTAGKVKVTNRPGQEGTLNGVLVD